MLKTARRLFQGRKIAVGYGDSSETAGAVIPVTMEI